jgi:hypothetical protein
MDTWGPIWVLQAILILSIFSSCVSPVVPFFDIIEQGKKKEVEKIRS